ncbi:transcriptional regulator [Nocardioides marmoriginsengisoli]|uniref:Transcriptional regulator n=1 Tax=Nocardioides marmoriginsengisoli TaxID=661483 RepID=A0A3N0CEU5_9ACTN|nr:helix-turn-helix domain-containing protein [Nocardioides marmoriginsengisoli]RNL61977.1 transcriptional regulator [Nocardioides marmoriginsengisoli]
MFEEERGLAGIAALAEPIRRDLYRFVVEARGPVSREAAADGVGIPAHTAKFHLDRLVDEGLLDVEFMRLSGRTGPGAGRPAKVYRRSGVEISVSLPERHYDLLSRILATAVAESATTGEPVVGVASRVARDAGARSGAAEASEAPRELDRLAAALVGSGYEPRIDDDTLLLHNCPFHRVAQEQTELVCGLNLEYVSGVVEGLGCSGVRADLAPGEGRCCVTAAEKNPSD